MPNRKIFEENYLKFFNYFNAHHSLEEIKDYINKNKIPKNSFCINNQINLNMIDSQNLNILFYIVKTSDSDDDCYEKMKSLIEEYNVDYNGFDFNYQRSLPFYTCVKGYIKSTKYKLKK